MNFPEKAVLGPDMISTEKEIRECVTQSLGSLQSIWADMGVHGEAKVERLQSFRNHVLKLLQEMVEEEESYKLLIVHRIEQHMENICKLKKELSGDSSSPLEEDLTNAPLYQVEKCLREKWSHFQKVKEERIEQLEDLQKRLDDVRVKLGKKDLSPHSGGITDIDLEALKCRISLLEQERDRLQATFEETRATILKIFEDLEMTPSLAFDKLVVSTPSGFVLSPENMSALKKLHQTMEQKLLDSKDYATVLRERLSNLWERLQISPDHREAFLHAYRGYSHPTICALKQELSKCEALKRANIENFVRKLREEIVSWWDRCCFSKEQREEFQAFFYTDFNEDVLEMHELEVNKLREYYEKYRDIFQLAERRGELWSKMLELEGRANDPNRLFNNRGGQLLREERERNAISKALPKIEMELKEQLLAYQQERGTPFLIDGENVLDVINQQNEERYGMKELQKQQKKVTRNHQLEVESKLGSKPVTPTSYKRGGKLCPSTPCQSVLGSSQKTLTIFATRSAPPRTVTASTKRKADLSPHCNVSKKSKGGRKSTEKRSSRSGNKSGPRYSTSKVRRFGKGASKMLQVSASKTRRNILNQLPVPVDNCSIASRVGPYSEFQSGFILNSSAFPSCSASESVGADEHGESLSELCCAAKLSSPREEHSCEGIVL